MNVETFEGLLKVESLEAWRQTCAQLTQALGFDLFLYGLRPNRACDTYVVISTYPVSWRNEYDSRGFVHCDPTVRHCSTRTLPLLWTPALFSGFRESQLYTAACEHGLRSGISVPIHGAQGESAIVSLASEAAPSAAILRQHRERSSAAQLLAAYMHESAARFLAKNEKGGQPHLTQRELECLKWIAMGKTAWETARIMRCSERTINFHVANVNAKLGVTNRRHAATRALVLGLISL